MNFTLLGNGNLLLGDIAIPLHEFLGSAALGFTLNRFILRRITPGPTKAIAFAASRAICYAPAIFHVAHGDYLAHPLLAHLVWMFLLNLQGVTLSALHEIGWDLNLPTLLLPIAVFLGSLAVALSKRFGLWFSGLLAVHFALFFVLPFAQSSWHDRPVLFSVNAFPWYPLQYFLHLPGTQFNGLTLPGQFGWLWCLGVWLVLYGLLAIAFARLTLPRAGVGLAPH
jgi:hypothetical protein